MMPSRKVQRLAIAIGVIAALCSLAGSGYGKHKKSEEPPFEYVAGTENAENGCAGKLEVLKEGFTFRCEGSVINLPYSGITLMQYRPNVSRKVLDMKIPWVLKPQLPRVRGNKFFTIVCNDQGKLRAVVLRVDENDMRPYFAEIELESGKSVEEYRSYDEF